jgi:HEAT repeat protein
MRMRSNSPWSMVNSPWSVDGRWSWGAAALLALSVVSGSSTVYAQKYTFEEVASGLKHADVATRLRAIQILKDADYADAAGPIAALLEDPDDRVQLAAIDAERSLFTTRSFARRRRVGFVVETRSIAGGEAAAEGRLALKARAVPAEVLSSLGVALRDSNPRVRAEAINLASLLAPVGCRFDSIETSDDMCSRIGDAVVDNINSREPVLRRGAMHALGQLAYPNGAQALSDQLSYYQKGPDAVAALEGLAGIGHPTSTSIFQRYLASSNADMRQLAVEGLGRSGDREVLGELQQIATTERSGGVLLAMHYAHLKLGGEGGGLDQLVIALKPAALRPTAIRYLLDLAQKMAPALAASLTDESADVRRLIADVLGFSRDTTVIPALQSATKDADPDVALAAQRAIERINIR